MFSNAIFNKRHAYWFTEALMISGKVYIFYFTIYILDFFLFPVFTFSSLSWLLLAPQILTQVILWNFSATSCCYCCYQLSFPTMKSLLPFLIKTPLSNKGLHARKLLLGRMLPHQGQNRKVMSAVFKMELSSVIT